MSDLASRKAKKDQYSNIAYGLVTMSAANTLTFAAIQLAVGLFQGIAILLHRILWQPSAPSVREMIASTDTLTAALTSSNRLSTLTDVTDPAILARIERIGIGVAIESVMLPWISDFTMLPGGGKLVSANPLYMAMSTAGAAAASVMRAQLDFTLIELNDRDYLELIQAQFPVNLS